MANGTNGIKPQAGPCEGNMFGDFETYGDDPTYYEPKFGDFGWIGEGETQSGQEAGDAGSYRSRNVCSDFTDAPKYGKVLSVEEDRGRNPQAERLWVNAGKADRGSES